MPGLRSGGQAQAAHNTRPYPGRTGHSSRTERHVGNVSITERVARSRPIAHHGTFSVVTSG
jgi:hypothetical protein